MAEPVDLGLQVSPILLVGWNRQGNLFQNGESVTLDPCSFRRVVGHQSHRSDTQVIENLRANPVVPRINGQPEIGVGVDGVESFILKPVGGKFVQQTDPAALMASDVENDTSTIGCDLSHSCVDLIATITAQAAEHVAGQAL